MIKVNASADTIVVNDLENHIMNSFGKEYDKITSNYKKLIEKGQFDKRKGLKGLVTLINDGAEDYAKQYASEGTKWQKMFNMEVRKEVANSLLDSFLMDENLQTKGNDMNSTATDNLISKFDIAQCKEAIESGNYSGNELDSITKKLKAMEDMKAGGLETKAGKTPRLVIHTKGQLNYQTVYADNDMKKYLGELQKKRDISSKHDKSKDEVAIEAKTDEIYRNIMEKSNALSSKANEEFDFNTLACDDLETKACPVKDKEDLILQANELGLANIIASEISEETGNLISKFGKMKYDECKSAIESGEHDGDDLDFLTKKLAGMDRMKSGKMAGRGPSVTAEDVKDKVSDVIPSATDFNAEEKVSDIIDNPVTFQDKI